jgi:hypothetical protein
MLLSSIGSIIVATRLSRGAMKVMIVSESSLKLAQNSPRDILSFGSLEARIPISSIGFALAIQR